jgi:hypothetical protein
VIANTITGTVHSDNAFATKAQEENAQKLGSLTYARNPSAALTSNGPNRFDELTKGLTPGSQPSPEGSTQNKEHSPHYSSIAVHTGQRSSEQGVGSASQQSMKNNVS